MSNALAIAGVTAVLKDLLDNGLIDHQASSALGVGYDVTAVAPDSVVIGGSGTSPSLNLFLHQVTLNAAYRNVDLPLRNARGARTGSPPLALDLHYLLTAYGVAELQAEVLLGYALQLLHENPVLGREQIRTALNPDPLSGTVLPGISQALRSADLAEQVEMIKVTPTVLGTEEMSRLWSALQAHYRPSAAFQVSVVLIQRQLPAISPLPVLRRGELDQGVQVTAGLEPPYPTLKALAAPAHGTPSVLRLGDGFELHGHHLAGTQRALALRNDAFGVVHTQTVPDGTNDKLVGATLTGLPANLPVGLYQLEMRVLQPAHATPQTSNALPVALAPSIDVASVVMTRNAQNVLSLQLDCQPDLRVGQRVSLLLDALEAAAEPITANTAARPRFLFRAAPPAGGRPLVRLKVDGIESVVVNRAATPPSFFNERVTLP